MPHRAHKSFDSIEEIETKVDQKIRKDVKAYLSHPSNIKKLTKIILKTPSGIKKEGNIQLVEAFENIEINLGNVYNMTLIFDNNEQNKAYFIQDSGVTIKY